MNHYSARLMNRICILYLSFVFFISVIYSFPAFSQSMIVSTEATVKDKYPKKIGNLRLSANVLAMLTVKSNASKSDTIKIFNAWNQPMTVGFSKVSLHIKMEAVPGKIEPGKTGFVICHYDAAKKNDYGFVMDKIILQTNDSLQPNKTVSITANIEEYFPPMNSLDSANAPRAGFTESRFDFGKVNQGEKVQHNFEIKNTGKKELLIRKTKSSCGCTVSQLEKTTVPPGESTFIKVTFNSSGRQGKEDRDITVITNDPFKPVSVIFLNGEVMKQ